jgi:cyclopropane-fatty-acyl-phospholipid synthase
MTDHLLHPARLEFEPPSARLPVPLRRIIARAEMMRFGRLLIRFPNGHRLTIRGSQPGPEAELEIHRMRLLRRVLFGGHLAFSEAYVDGDWDSPDPAILIDYFVRNESALAIEGSWFTRLVERLNHALKANTRTGSRRNIAAHYDLGNSFYRQWLDPSMTYSSAVYVQGQNSLEAAQTEKYRRIADMAGVKPGSTVLEIGCGWGGFAEYAARLGAKVVGLTLSTEQLSYARQRLSDAGLADQADLRLQDYRDVQGQFDAVVSIEMIEAVGERYWPVYFGKIAEVLKQGGRAALQAILIEDTRFPIYRRSPDFIQRHVFPGGMLPSPQRLRDETTAAGLTLVEQASYRLDYARTLREWRGKFESTWESIRPLGFDERFRRLWRYYLAYCEGGFTAGSIDLVQVAFQKP